MINFLICLILMQQNAVKIEVATMIAEARIECVKADLKLSEIELVNAESNYNRCCKLKNSTTISDEHYGAAVQRFDNAKVNVFRNKARLKEAEGLYKIAKITGEVDKTLTPR